MAKHWHQRYYQFASSQPQQLSLKQSLSSLQSLVAFQPYDLLEKQKEPHLLHGGGGPAGAHGGLCTLLKVKQEICGQDNVLHDFYLLSKNEQISRQLHFCRTPAPLKQVNCAEENCVSFPHICQQRKWGGDAEKLNILHFSLF